MANDPVFPPLTVADAENIIEDLENALSAHHAWSRQFQATLVCRSKPSANDLSSDGHRKDDFGIWYHQEGNEHLRHHPDFIAMGRKHRDLHMVARKLARIALKKGRIAPASYYAFQRRVEDFRDQIAAILDDAREMLRYSDPLTGIATRFAILPRLDQERERAARTGEPSAVGMVDLDRFKRINDTWGHNAGDIVLREVARYLLKNIRRYDQVCRYGGEEFLILLPSTDPRKAKRVLDRLRRGLKRRRIEIGTGEPLSVSASFGIAALDPDEPIMASIDHADQAMYQAKMAGRNRVRIWPGDDPGK